MNSFAGMRRIWALAKKEFHSFMLSPLFYITAIFFLLFVSVHFYYIEGFFLLDTAALGPFFSSFPLVFIFVIPAITMKSWAGEKKQGTLELLLAMPFSEVELCIGKFLSSLLVFIAMLIPGAAIPLSLFPLGSFDPGLIAAEYTGVFLLGASAICLGLFLSCLSKNQAFSFLGSSAILLVLMIPGRPGFGASLPKGPADFINYFSLSFHFQSFSRGILDSRDLAFFILCSTLFLFLNTRALLYGRLK